MENKQSYFQYEKNKNQNYNIMNVTDANLVRRNVSSAGSMAGPEVTKNGRPM